MTNGITMCSQVTWWRVIKCYYIYIAATLIHTCTYMVFWFNHSDRLFIVGRGGYYSKSTLIQEAVINIINIKHCVPLHGDCVYCSTTVDYEFHSVIIQIVVACKNVSRSFGYSFTAGLCLTQQIAVRIW